MGGREVGGGRATVVLSRGEISAVLLAFGLIVSVYMVLLAGPTSAQDTGGSGPPAGTPVGTQNTDNPSSPPTLFSIPAEDCTVENTGASVTFEESDGTQGRLVDGRGVEITGTPTQIRVEILNEGDFFSDVAEFPSSDRAFDTGNDITVVTSTNITCAGGTGTTGGPTSVPSTPENSVIRRTIPKKPLPPTGGLPVYVMVSGSVLAGAGLLGLGIVVRRGSRG